MNRICIPLFLALFCLNFLWAQDRGARPAGANPTLPLQQVFTPAEYKEYLSEPAFKSHLDLYEEVLKRYDRMISKEVRSHSMEKSLETLQQLRSLIHHVVAEAENVTNKKEFRSKQAKQLEITIRKVAETIDTLKGSVFLQYQPSFEMAARDLDRLRDLLLVHIFGEAFAAGNRQSSRSRDMASVDLLPANEAVARAAAAALDDRFTPEEFAELQANQSLVKRVELFIEIANTRLEEIRRRMENKPWTRKEVNPLEFHTYSDMVHSYQRAIDSAMINIDEKARYKTAPAKDIRKALEKLNSKVGVFQAQLELVKEFARQLRDEELYREILEAEEITEIARKGSELGLGPAEDDAGSPEGKQE
ncbi:MAG: hypothetical protein HY645_06435 [Acidobacteria bacterium]|nr:hypothetical protein [Acidobacteriota bacterium]